MQQRSAGEDRLVFELLHVEKVPIIVLCCETNKVDDETASKYLGIRPHDLGRLMHHCLTVLDRMSSAKTGAGQAAKGDPSGAD